MVHDTPRSLYPLWCTFGLLVIIPPFASEANFSPKEQLVTRDFAQRASYYLSVPCQIRHIDFDAQLQTLSIFPGVRLICLNFINNSFKKRKLYNTYKPLNHIFILRCRLITYITAVHNFVKITGYGTEIVQSYSGNCPMTIKFD